MNNLKSSVGLQKLSSQNTNNTMSTRGEVRLRLNRRVTPVINVTVSANFHSVAIWMTQPMRARIPNPTAKMKVKVMKGQQYWRCLSEYYISVGFWYWYWFTWIEISLSRYHSASFLLFWWRIGPREPLASHLTGIGWLGGGSRQLFTIIYKISIFYNVKIEISHVINLLIVTNTCEQ